MRRLLIAAVIVAGCVEPPKPNPAVQSIDHLRDIHYWDAQTQAKLHYAYEDMFAGFAVEPRVAVTLLIGRIGDPTPTAIEDNLHDPVPVGTVAFHILMKIFETGPEAFEAEGVWVMKSDPSKNPIYMVKFHDPDSRLKVAKRMKVMAQERGWIPMDEKQK